MRVESGDTPVPSQQVDVLPGQTLKWYPTSSKEIVATLPPLESTRFKEPKADMSPSRRRHLFMSSPTSRDCNLTASGVKKKYLLGHATPTLLDVVTMVSMFLGESDRKSLRRTSKLCHPEWGHTPLFPLWPLTLYKRQLGFGADSPDISASYEGTTEEDVISRELQLHFVWDFLEPKDRKNYAEVFPAMKFYHKLRLKSAQGFHIHSCRNLESQKGSPQLSHRKAIQMAIALLRANFQYPDMFRWLGGIYNNKHRDLTSAFDIIERTLEHDTPPGYPPVDADRAWRLSTEGAPLAGHFSCSRRSVAKRNQVDNGDSVKEAMEQIMEKFVKEEAFGYHIFFPRVIWRFIPGLALALITWVPPKPHRVGDSGRICIDPSSTINKSDDGNMNRHIPDTGEDHDQNPSVHYGTALMRFLRLIYNLRLDHPEEEIYLSADDISAAFRRILYNPAAAIVFATVLSKYLIVPVGGIFGSKSSPGFYMIKGELRAHVARHIGDYTSAQTSLADTVEFSSPPSNNEVSSFTPADSDSINKGCAHLLGVSQEEAEKSAFSSFVDDTGIAGIEENIRDRINRSILSSYEIMGFPHEDPVRPEPINPKKFHPWVTFILTFLGYSLNTRSLSLSWPASKQYQLRVYVKAVLDSQIVNNKGRRISPQQAARVLGLIRHGAITHMLGLYLTMALQFGLSDEIRGSATTALRQNPRRFWVKHRFNISAETVRELELLLEMLPGSASSPAHPIWTRKIGLIIPRDCLFEFPGDASLEGLGGWVLHPFYAMWRIDTEALIGFGIKVSESGWDARHQDSVQDAEAKVNINILEFIVLIIDLWLAVKLWQRLENRPSNDLIFRLRTDNTSALSWAMRAAKTKQPRIRRIARLFQALLTQSPVPLSLQTTHIAGVDNHNADILSRPLSQAPTWASVIEHSKPSLREAMPYQLPFKLLSTISNVIKYDWTGERLVKVTTELWTLEPNIFPSGIETWEGIRNTYKPSRKRRARRSRF